MREGTGRVGKPATLLGVVPDARFTIAVDLSDDERFHAALVDLAGKVLDRRVAERDGRTGDAAVEPRPRPVRRPGRRRRPAAARRRRRQPRRGRPAGRRRRGPQPRLGRARPGRLPRRGASTLPVHVANDANAAVLGELGLGGPPTAACSSSRSARASAPAWSSTATWSSATASRPARSATSSSTPTARPAPAGASGASRPSSPPPASAAAPRRATPSPSAPRPVAASARRWPRWSARSTCARWCCRGRSTCSTRRSGRRRSPPIRARTMPAVGDNVDLRFSSLGEDDVLLGAAMLVLDRELGVA